MAITAMAATVALGAASAHAQKYTWRMTTFVPEGTSTYRDYVQVFIDTVHTVTNGDVKIQGFGAGVLASFSEAYKAVQQGTADIGYMYPGFLINADPTNAIIAGFPGGMGPEAMMHWVYNTEGGKLWTEYRRAMNGLHALQSGISPTEIFLHSHKKVETAEDLKGMKIRTAGAWADVLKQFGAVPTIMAPADIFAALERKVIDGTEYITPGSNVSQGFHKVARYIIVPGMHSPGSMNDVVWKTEVWDAVPKEIREKLELAAKLACFETYLKLGILDMNAIEEMKKGRNEWVNLKPELLAAITSESRKWAEAKSKEQTAKGNPWMQKLADSYFTFDDKWNKDMFYRKF
ncbi:MAG: TRAP transporter substrate-binding protein DctP [Rhodospirillales bacterium]